MGRRALCPDSSTSAWRGRAALRSSASPLRRTSSGCLREVGDDEGALLDCTAVAVHALARVPVRPGAAVTVLGAGAIGLAVAQAGHALRRTCHRRRPATGPLDLALELGSHAVVDLGAGEASRPPERTSSSRPRAARRSSSDRSPRPAAGATVGLVGEAFDPQLLDVAGAMTRELTLAFVWSHDGRGEYARALELAARGAVRLAPAVTHRYPLTELEEAFAAAADRQRSGAIKVMVTP